MDIRKGNLYEGIVTREPTNRQANEKILSAYDKMLMNEKYKVAQNPKDKLSEILCDADLMHLTYNNYFDLVEMMRMEWQFMGIAKMTIKEFHKNSVNFFNTHHYHSEYGRKVLEPKKEKNLNRIKAEIF